MFSGTLEFKLLAAGDITATLLADLNALLKQQHNDARMLTPAILREHIDRSSITVALLDGRPVGVAVMAKTFALSHVVATLLNIVVNSAYDFLTVGLQLGQHVIAQTHDVEYIEAEAHLDGQALVTLLEMLGFEVRDKRRFRLKENK